MRVYLDDERVPPGGWVRVYWPEEAIALLESGQVEEINLDHDLGDDEHGTGYDVVLRIEEAVALREFKQPHMYVHSANSSAKAEDVVRHSCDPGPAPKAGAARYLTVTNVLTWPVA